MEKLPDELRKLFLCLKQNTENCNLIVQIQLVDLI